MHDQIEAHLFVQSIGDIKKKSLTMDPEVFLVLGLSLLVFLVLSVLENGSVTESIFCHINSLVSHPIN